ncbi:MAG: hypothetical protein SFX73_22860 [Kofleriaceae bacterium]|nr:hypothetical protein [Kofleriaceae bacterium]
MGEENRSSLVPRRARIILPGVVYHLISRFVASEWFINTEYERRTYLQLLGRGLESADWRCFAFAIMSNHIHLALVAGRAPLASWLGEVHGTFAEWINERRERIGAVFVRGPRSIAIRHDRVDRLVAYIHGNPVRAGVVPHAMDSSWTSHRAYLQRELAPSWLDVDLGLELTRFADGAELDAWVERSSISRTQMDEARLVPVNRGGRPPGRTGTGLAAR